MMEIQRLILFVVFSFSLLLLWEAWQKEHKPQPAAVATAPAATAASSNSGVPTPTPALPAATTAVPAAAPVPAGPVAQTHERVHVATDLLRVEIDTLGGDIVALELLTHPDTVDKEKNFVLLGPQHRYAAQSGLIGDGLPNHKTLYSAKETKYALEQGKNTIEVRLDAAGINAANGVQVTKIITFHRGSYLIDIAHEVRNASSAPLSAHTYLQLTRDGKSPDGSQAMMYTYTGAAVYTQKENFRKVDFSDIDQGKTNYPKTADNGWIALLQHYFVTAVILPEQQTREFYTKKLADNFYAVGAIVPVAAIAPGGVGKAKVSLYAGPEEQDKLKEIAPGLELVVDYGWLTVIAAPLFWVLQFFHGWLGNWGLAIIFLTVCIKLVFYPLSAASYRSMAKMKLVTPRLVKIREQHANDRMKQNQAMMDLYKEEKINPLGGCLPVVVQIPVFISLYWVLLASVELRHAPFYGWITNLAVEDPYYILPALMMASMIVQTKMSPTPPDPVQAKVMQIMPLVFGVMFFVFPAGLVLYWLVNNVLSIAQQWHITRMIEGQRAAVSPKR